MTSVTNISGTCAPAVSSVKSGQQSGDAGSATASTGQSSSDSYINPQTSIDPQTGAVILEYRSDSGTLVRQVPSEYELRSYQSHAAKPPTG